MHPFVKKGPSPFLTSSEPAPACAGGWLFEACLLYTSTLVVDKSVLDSGSVTCPGCGQEFEIELGYEDEDDDENTPEE